MKRCKERLDDISKGVIFIESDKNSRARIVRLVAMAGQYAALSIASGVRTQELWGKFLTSMELDQNAMVSDAQATLTGQTSMHGLDAVAGSNVSLPVPSAALTGAPFTLGPSSGAGASASAASPAPAKTAPPAAPLFAGGASAPAPAPEASGALFSGSSAPAPAPAAGGLFGGSTVDL